MFDAVLHPQRTSAKRWSASALTAILIHVVLIAIALGVAHEHKKKSKVEVTFVKAKPIATNAPPPPPPPPPPKRHKTVEHKVIPKNVIIPPKEIPKEKPPEKPPEPPEEEDSSEDDGVEGGVEGGVKGGVVGGVVGEVVGGVLGGTGKRMDFDDKTMVRPVPIFAPIPEYTPQAIEHEIEGLISVRCVLGTDGLVRECKVLKSLPFMDRVVVETLEKRKYKPVMVQGQPVEVNYTFNLRLTLPE